MYSCATLAFPTAIRRSDLRSCPGTWAPSVDRARSRLVHVVDDEDAIRRSLAFLLRTAGYSVMCWSSGDDFVKRVDTTVPACALLDFVMPGLGGLAVQEHMMANGFEFPIIMMSGCGDPTITLRAIMAGAVDLIEKPFDRARLLRTVAAAFDRLTAQVSLRGERHEADKKIAKLTQREREVLAGLACGYSNKIIADDLGLSSHSVEVYRANAMAKLQVTYFADALRIAFTGGLGTMKDLSNRTGIGRTAAR